MKICIFGAGAGGGHMAVRLAQSGHDVSAIARGPQLQAIRDGGLVLLSGERRMHAAIAASDDPAELGPQDLVVVTVKATALADVADRIGPLVGPDTRVLFTQNGMQWWYPLGLDGRRSTPDIPVFRLADAFLRTMRPEQVLGAILYTANEVTVPGTVVNTSPDHNRIYMAAAMDGAAEPVDVRAVFQHAGITALEVPDIRERLWKKLLFNMSSSAIALVTGNLSSITRHDPELPETFTRLVQEGLRIAEAWGYRLHDDMVPEQMLTLLLDHKPSILQDYERHRRMEVAEILLAPLAMARAANIDAPTLQTVAAIARRLAEDRALL